MHVAQDISNHNSYIATAMRTIKNEKWTYFLAERKGKCLSVKILELVYYSYGSIEISTSGSEQQAYRLPAGKTN